MNRMPKLGTADSHFLLFSVIVAVLGIFLFYFAFSQGDVSGAITLAVIFIGPLVLYIAFNTTKAWLLIRSKSGDEQVLLRKELRYEEAALLAEFWGLCVTAPIWIGSLTAVGVWGYQFYGWLRIGTAPSMSLKALGLFNPQTDWVGLQKVLNFFAEGNSGVYAFVAGLIVGLMFNGKYGESEARAGSLKKEFFGESRNS